MRKALIFLIIILSTKLASSQEFPEDKTHTTSRVQIESLKAGSLGAAQSSPRRLPTIAIDLIKDFESWVPHPYNDASNYCTIGYGHLIDLKPCIQLDSEIKKYSIPLTETIGLSLLDRDTTLARLSIQQLVRKPLSDEQFGAITSFVFNVGSSNFEKSRLLRYINNAEYDGATKQFARWVKSDGKILTGLVTRRNCEAALFSGKLFYSPGNKFDRSQCSSLGAAPSVENLIDIEVGE